MNNDVAFMVGVWWRLWGLEFPEDAENSMEIDSRELGANRKSLLCGEEWAD